MKYSKAATKKDIVTQADEMLKHGRVRSYLSCIVKCVEMYLNWKCRHELNPSRHMY
jgi:hypothetical protein